MKFRKKKWQKFQRFVSKMRKKNFYNTVSYFLFNFKNFFTRKFKYNLQNKQKLSLNYGGLRKKYLKKLVRSTLNEFKSSNTYATVLLIEKLESRLDTALCRAYFSYSFNNARQLILHKKVYVNGKIITHNSYLLKKGDLITLEQTAFKFISFNILKSKNWAMPPKHFHINYKTFQILIIDDIKYTNFLRHYNFWLDFNSFLQFYHK